MTPNPALMTLSDELTCFLLALNEFQARDVPPRWSEDEFRAHEDSRDDLMNWKAALLERITEDMEG